MQSHLANIYKENISAVKEATEDMELAAMSLLCNEYSTCMFIRISGNGRYRSLNSNLDNEHILKIYAYPKTLDTALQLLVNFYTQGNGPRCNVTNK